MQTGTLENQPPDQEQRMGEIATEAFVEMPEAGLTANDRLAGPISEVLKSEWYADRQRMDRCKNRCPIKND